ncbi:MAG TPA: AAA family ATPase, partial [Acetobacteraceae bacterium]|nr:AAA family ATPase [Acetobacteraceae bacterium]
PRAAIAGRFYLSSGRTRRLRMAELDETGIVHPDQQAVVGAALAAGIGLIVVDPFVKSHQLDENANAQIDAAATAWAEIAEATGAAVLLVHHVRKGATSDVDAMRGAKALTDAARSAALLTPMTAEEARHLSVPERERWRHVRLDDAKANMAPRADAAQWFRLESVALGNHTPLYPHGDSVAAIAAWKPPSPFRQLSPVECNRALDKIAAGIGDGAAFSAHRTGRATERWAGSVLVRGFGLDEADATRVIAAWLRSGLLVEEEYRHPTQRKLRMGVRVDDARRPTVVTPAGETHREQGTDHE